MNNCIQLTKAFDYISYVCYLKGASDLLSEANP